MQPLQRPTSKQAPLRQYKTCASSVACHVFAAVPAELLFLETKNLEKHAGGGAPGTVKTDAASSALSPATDPSAEQLDTGHWPAFSSWPACGRVFFRHSKAKHEGPNR